LQDKFFIKNADKFHSREILLDLRRCLMKFLHVFAILVSLTFNPVFAQEDEGDSSGEEQSQVKGDRKEKREARHEKRKERREERREKHKEKRKERREKRKK
jgi:hypothetical protein